MTRYVFAAVGIVVAGAAGAQTPSPAQPTTAPTAHDQSITVAGCLKPWTEMGSTATPTTPAPSPTPSTIPRTGASYILTGIEEKDPPVATETRGEAGAATAAARPREAYLLKAEGTVDLAAHANHQVEVTGQVVSMPMNAAPAPRTATPETAGTPGTPGTPGRPVPGMTREDGHKTAPQTLSVTSLKMLSATCK